MQYRRSRIAGGTYFFTLLTYQRRRLFEDTNNIVLLRKAIQAVKFKYPFKIDAFVLLPDHLHCIWTLPVNDNEFPVRWRLIKSYFTKAMPQSYKRLSTPARIYKHEQRVWQRRYWEHQIRDYNDLIKHVEYIHYNPVKHGYVKVAIDWPYSSFHHYVKAKMYKSDWGTGEEIIFAKEIGGE